MFKKTSQYPRLTVDPVLFVVDENSVKVLLVQRQNAPDKGVWALPGGHSYAQEQMQDKASQSLQDKTGYPTDKIRFIDQLYAFDTHTSDPRGHAVTVSFLMFGPKLEVNETAQYFDVNDIPQLAFEHNVIVDKAIERVRRELSLTTLIAKLVPREFTLNQLHGVYESVLNTPLDNRNFRKKFLAFNLTEDTGKKEQGTAHRPSKLYRFKQRDILPLSNTF